VKSRARFDQITVPFYSSGNWGGWNHHLRGNVEAYVRSASTHKKLQIHIGGHTDAFYSDEGKLEMLRWYDYWLKGKDNGIMDEPPVKLCIRVSVDECNWRFENEWPLARTQYKKYYLSSQAAGVVDDAMHDLQLRQAAPPKGGEITFPSGPEAYRRGRSGQPMVTFVTEPLTEDVEVTGHIKLMLWVSSETDDMDVFAYLRNMAPDGSVETATRGILKVSHRKLDPELSKSYRPYHTHDEEQKLRPGQVVPIEIEIWATSMVFKKGHRIRLDVQPHDGEHYFAAYKLRNNSIYIGGDRPSYMLLPVIPAQD
jgi:putative CocE/NonD family hydrolase